MSLRTRVRILAALLSISALCLSVLYFHTQHREQTLEKDLQALQEIRREINELRTVGFEFAMYREERSWVQAATKLRQVQTALEQVRQMSTYRDTAAEMAPLWEEARLSLQDCQNLLAEMRQGADTPALQERNRRTVNLFLLRSLSLVSAGEALRHPLELSLRQQRHFDDAVLTGALVALLALAILAIVLIQRAVLRPVSRLSAAVAAVATGDLDFRLQRRESDEFGQLARAFDHMLERIRDMTVSRAELETLVQRRTADLELANQELDAFAYSVSHDLRAPLRAIDGFGRKFETDYGERLDDEGQRLLDVIRGNARRMGALIDDLLAFSRMGKREMLLLPLEMDSLVRAVVDELRLAESPERRIEVDIAPLPPSQGDPSTVRQVWFNLLSNAFKFTQPRTPARIQVGSSRKNDSTVFWVKDNGVGFDMAYADKLFSVFKRLHGRREFEGTGVGLALCQRIIQRHGGRIWAHARRDEGATFFFTLPAAPAAGTKETSS